MAAWNSWKLLRDEFVKRLKFGVRIMAGQKSDLAGEAEAVRVDTGRLEVIPKYAVAGGTPDGAVGITLRLPEPLTHQINAVGPKSIVVTAKKAGVTLTITTGAGPLAVSAIGDAVTFSGVIVGVSTVTDLLTAIGLSAAVDALLSVAGTGADTFGAAYAGLTTTALYTDRTAALTGIGGRTITGKWVPFKLTEDGELNIAATVADEVTVKSPTATNLKAQAEPYLPVAGAAPTAAAGLPGRMQEAKAIVIDTLAIPTCVLTVTPKVAGVAIVVTAGATRTLDVVGRIIYCQWIAGTTTSAEILADFAASPACSALASFAFNVVGAVEAAFAGGVAYCYTDRTVHTFQAFERDANGVVVPVPGGGVLRSRTPRAVTVGYGDGLSYTAIPLATGVTFNVGSGAARALSVSGKTVTATVILTTTTLAEVIADIAADPEAAALIALSGTAGVFPAAWAGSVATLWEDTFTSAGNAFLLDEDGYAEVPAGDGFGNAKGQAMLPATSGAQPSKVRGTTGRLNQDLSYAIAAGKTISFHPLQHGVSVSVVSGGATAVLATGRAVVFTEKADDTTTLTLMLAALAASNAAGLVAINLGTAVGGDTWNHLLTQPDTALWASGTIPAQVAVALYPDGYNWPLEVDATGGLKSSQSSLAFFEDASRGVARIEKQPTSSAWQAGSAIIVAAGIAGRTYSVDMLVSGGAGATVNLRDDAVVGGTIRRQFIYTTDGYKHEEVGDFAYGNGLYLEVNAGTCAHSVNYRNG
jgi:hypothetical protein